MTLPTDDHHLYDLPRDNLMRQVYTAHNVRCSADLRGLSGATLHAIRDLHDALIGDVGEPATPEDMVRLMSEAIRPKTPMDELRAAARDLPTDGARAILREALDQAETIEADEKRSDETASTEERRLTAKQVAAAINVSPRTVRRWAPDLDAAVMTPDGWRFSPEFVRGWIDGERQQRPCPLCSGGGGHGVDSTSSPETDAAGTPDPR